MHLGERCVCSLPILVLIQGIAMYSWLITALEHTNYKVFVEAHPHAQTCTLTSFAGVLHGVKDVDNVRAMCTDNPWEVGGILTGIKPGLSVVVLQLLLLPAFMLLLLALSLPMRLFYGTFHFGL